MTLLCCRRWDPLKRPLYVRACCTSAVYTRGMQLLVAHGRPNNCRQTCVYNGDEKQKKEKQGTVVGGYEQESPTAVNQL